MFERIFLTIYYSFFIATIGGWDKSLSFVPLIPRYECRVSGFYKTENDIHAIRCFVVINAFTGDNLVDES